MRAAFVLGVLVSTASLAQVDAQSDKGSVQVGPGGGVKVKGKKGNVVIAPDGTIKATGASGTAVVGADGTVDAKGVSGTAKVGPDGAVEVKGTGPRASPVLVGVEAGKAPIANGKVEFRGNGQPYTHACAPGQKVEVHGTGNAVTLTGECGDVEVHGTGNNVTVEAAEKLDVHGTGNNATWQRGAGGKAEPKVKLKGVGNNASRAAQ